MNHSPAIHIIDDVLAGKIRADIAQLALTHIGVYGSFRDHRYSGYDYRYQVHIERSRPVFQRGPIVIPYGQIRTR